MDSVKEWILSLELDENIMSRPLAVKAWESALDSFDLPDDIFKGKIYAFICYSSPHLDDGLSLLTNFRAPNNN